MKLAAQILTFYSWALVCVLLFFLFSIARFFEQRLQAKQDQTQRQRYYPLFLLPVALFAVSALLYVFNADLVVGQRLADVLRIFGGITLVTVGYLLLNTMTGGKS